MKPSTNAQVTWVLAREYSRWASQQETAPVFQAWQSHTSKETVYWLHSTMHLFTHWVQKPKNPHIHSLPRTHLWQTTTITTKLFSFYYVTRCLSSHKWKWATSHKTHYKITREYDFSVTNNRARVIEGRNVTTSPNPTINKLVNTSFPLLTTGQGWWRDET